MVQVDNQNTKHMNTYYTKNPVNDTYTPATISADDAIAIIVQSAVTNAVNKANDIIASAVTARVTSAVEEANIKTMVASHLLTVNIGDIVDEALNDAARGYDYDGTIENAIDNLNIDEMVSEKVTDHLDSCSIQVSIR
jgi:hypothetical protein